MHPCIRKVLENAEHRAVLGDADPLEARGRTRKHATTVSLINPGVAMSYAAKPYNSASTMLTTAAPFSD